MPRSAPATEPTPERLHASAMANVRAREPGQAVLELTDLIARFPRHPLAAAAQLGIGEAYYQQGDCRQALVELGKVVEGYPGSAQVPDALLTIGLCRRSLGEPGGATAAWRRLVSEHQVQPGRRALGQEDRVGQRSLGKPGSVERNQDVLEYHGLPPFAVEIPRIR